MINFPLDILWVIVKLNCTLGSSWTVTFPLLGFITYWESSNSSFRVIKEMTTCIELSPKGNSNRLESWAKLRLDMLLLKGCMSNMK